MSNRIRELRKEKQLSMKELGAMFNLAESTISMYERGKRSPDPTTLSKFADFFGVSVDYLLGRPEKTPSAPPETVRDEDIKFALFGGGDPNGITDEMFEEVKRFAAFVKQREREKNGGNQS